MSLIRLSESSLSLCAGAFFSAPKRYIDFSRVGGDRDQTAAQRIIPETAITALSLLWAVSVLENILNSSLSGDFSSGPYSPRPPVAVNSLF